MSASCERAFVAAVARIECTHRPLTSALMPVSRPYFSDDVAVDGAGIEVPVERAGAVVLHRPEEGAVQIDAILPPAVFRHLRQIFLDQPRAIG